jgi:hypothetical protein
VQPQIANESDENNDEDQMDDIVANIGRTYDLESVDPPPNVQNFYRLLAASGKKVHDGIDVTVLQVVTRLIAMKSKYNFLNQCYNDIVNLIIDLISVKYNIPKDLYQSKKIVSGLGMNYKKIDACKTIACYFGRSTRTTLNICIVVGLDT